MDEKAFDALSQMNHVIYSIRHKKRMTQWHEEFSKQPQRSSSSTDPLDPPPPVLPDVETQNKTPAMLDDETFPVTVEDIQHFITTQGMYQINKEQSDHMDEEGQIEEEDEEKNEDGTEEKKQQQGRNQVSD